MICLNGPDGKRLDAKVEIEAETIILHSRGGAFGKSNLRNPDYRKALELILAKLKASQFRPSGVWLDSKPARALPEHERLLVGAAEFSRPTEHLASEISKQAAAFGRPLGTSGHGNSTKRIKIGVPGATAKQLAKLLESDEAIEVPPIIYFNIGWMKEYNGPDANDPTIGAHGYLDAHDHGAECYNFTRTPDGKVRGYRPPGRSEKVNISRLGASSGDEYLDGVLVIWLAKAPGSGKTLIVGWYQDATVFRNACDGGMVLNGEQHYYSVEALADDAVLLPPVAREFEVPSSRLKPGAGFGQKPTWYGSSETNSRVWNYVRTWQSARTEASKRTQKGKKPPKNNDPELRREVERAAVDHAIAYYKAKYGAACEIKSVEADGVGWDLEVRFESDELLVEVKGLYRDNLVCELTPNEYQKMQMPENMDRYVVYVVNNALAQAPAEPIASIFSHVGNGTWETGDGRVLVIKERTGAILSCS